MTTLPDYEAFARAYLAGEAEVAVTTLVADLETPVSAYLKLARTRAGNMFLLESVEGGAQRGRYSMIGLDPDLIFRSSGDRAEINRRALIDPDAFVPCPGDPLGALRALLAESRIAMPPGLPPMSAGIFGYLGYDMVRRMERLAPAKPDPIGVPEALLIRPTVMVVFDGARESFVIGQGGHRRFNCPRRIGGRPGGWRRQAPFVALRHIDRAGSRGSRCRAPRPWP